MGELIKEKRKWDTLKGRGHQDVGNIAPDDSTDVAGLLNFLGQLCYILGT